MTGYACKDCGALVAVDAEGRFARSCEHRGTIIASMTATAYGEGHVEPAPAASDRLTRLVGATVALLGLRRGAN